MVAGAARAGSGAGFGAGGEITTTFGSKSDDAGQAVVLQPDGRIVVVGYSSDGSVADNSAFALARYNSNGTLDPTFGARGRVRTTFGFANAAALQPDGRIVAAGGILVSRPDFDFALARYDTHGTLDPSFGSGGKVTTSFSPQSEFAGAVAIQPDGRIVVAGGSGSPQLRDEAFALARYDHDGALDSSFGSGGKVTTKFGPVGDDTAHAFAVQPDGKIVAAGDNFVAAREGSSDFALARFTPEGTLDPTFGSGGKVTTTFGSGSDFANAVALQPDGKIVVAGYTYVGGAAGHSYFAVARYRPDGSLDPSFGAGGEVTTDLGPGASAWAVALQRDGKIVAAGSAGVGSFALARYTPTGQLDPTFGSGGTVTTTIGLGEEALATALAVKPDGNVVAAGWSVTCTYQDFALTRYTPAGSLDTGFGRADKRCIVPNVRGLTLAQARRAIRRRDCAVGPISRSFSRTVAKGRVVAQFPRAGTECRTGAKIVLDVSKGKRKQR